MFSILNILRIVAALGTIGFVALLASKIYDAGVNSCTAKQITNTSQALKDRDNAQEIVNRTVDIDRLLSDLGILRQDSDR